MKTKKDPLAKADKQIQRILMDNRQEIKRQGELALYTDKSCDKCGRTIFSDEKEGETYLEFIDIRPEFVGQRSYTCVHCMEGHSLP